MGAPPRVFTGCPQPRRLVQTRRASQSVLCRFARRLVTAGATLYIRDSSFPSRGGLHVSHRHQAERIRHRFGDHPKDHQPAVRRLEEPGRHPRRDKNRAAEQSRPTEASNARSDVTVGLQNDPRRVRVVFPFSSGSFLVTDKRGVPQETSSTRERWASSST